MNEEIKDEMLRLAEIELSKPREELLEALDDIHISGTPSFSLAQKNALIERETKLNLVWQHVSTSICSDEAIHAVVNGQSQNRRALLVCMVVDHFTFGGGLTLAALFVQEGLHELCGSIWQAKD